MIYNIMYSKDCLKDILKFDKNILKRIKTTIEERLSSSPIEYAKPLKYTLKKLWSLRSGDYRVIFAIQGNNIIILKIGHRKEVYKFFKLEG